MTILGWYQFWSDLKSDRSLIRQKIIEYLPRSFLSNIARCTVDLGVITTVLMLVVPKLLWSNATAKTTAGSRASVMIFIFG